MNEVLGQETADGPPAEASSLALSPLEVEIIELFVELSRALGQPRSLAEIYGLLFIADHPLAMDELMERLQISKGSTSQGLKFLRSLGAVREVYVPGDRRVHYEAVAELRKLAGRFLREQLSPRLTRGEERLARIAEITKQLPNGERKRVNARLGMLRSWGKNTRRVLPLVIRVLGE